MDRDCERLMNQLIIMRSKRRNNQRDQKIALDYSMGDTLSEISRNHEISKSRAHEVLAKQFRELRRYLRLSMRDRDEEIPFLADEPFGKWYYRHPDAYTLFSEFFQAEASKSGTK